MEDNQYIPTNKTKYKKKRTHKSHYNEMTREDRDMFNEDKLNKVSKKKNICDDHIDGA